MPELALHLAKHLQQLGGFGAMPTNDGFQNAGIRGVHGHEFLLLALIALYQLTVKKHAFRREMDCRGHG